MNSTISIKNFRVFNEDGVILELKPLTVLTGCNSAGKSSIVRAVLLINTYLTQVKNAIENNEPINLREFKIDYSTYPNNQLGRFDRIVHEGSSLKKICIGYSVYSHMLSEDVDVLLEFVSDDNDELNNAYLDSITMKTKDGAFYSSCRDNAPVCNLNIVREQCLEFLPIEYIIHNLCGLEQVYDIENNISKDEYDSSRDAMLSFLRNCDKQRIKDILKYIRTTSNKDSIVVRNNVKPEVIEWTITNGSFFMIPVLEWLNSLPKENLSIEVQNKLLQNSTDTLIKASNKIIRDYVDSNFETFGEYFKNYENLFFEDLKIITFSKKRTPSLLKPSYMNINQNDVLQELFNSSAVFYDFNGNRTTPIKIKEFDDPVSFSLLYNVVMLWNKKFNSEDDSIFYNCTDFGSLYFTHSMYKLLTTFFTDILNEVVCPEWCGNVEYVSSSRATIKRLYTLDSEDDFSSLLKKYFEKKRQYLEYQKSGRTPMRDYKVNSFMNHWIKEFGIGDSITLSTDEEGLGVQIRLHNTAEDKGRVLADEGYGITSILSVLLQIETAILSAKGERVNRHYGLSLLDKYNDNDFHYEINTIAIEEPEIHLHPSYQSKLAEMFAEAYVKYNIQFLIETHSEYLIRKLQILGANKTISPESISILYVYNPKEKPGYEPLVKKIMIREDGVLEGTFGKGFFDEADRLSLSLLTILSEND